MSAQILDDLYDEGLEIEFEEEFDRKKQNSLIHLYNKKFGITEDVRKLILSEKDSKILNKAIEAVLEVSTADEVTSILRFNSSAKDKFARYPMESLYIFVP